MTSYYPAISAREFVYLAHTRIPIWELLDYQPVGWLTSIKNAADVPAKIIMDCGAWTYRKLDTPSIDGELVNATWAHQRYLNCTKCGDILTAPDHMIIPGVNWQARMDYNRSNAQQFVKICPAQQWAMAVVHGDTIQQRLDYCAELAAMGYKYIALGGLAGRASNRRLVTAVVEAVRDAFPELQLHVFGISSLNYVRLWKSIGIQSYDGSKYMQGAIRGEYFWEYGGLLRFYNIKKDSDIPVCHCKACTFLRDWNVDTRMFGSVSANMGRAAHNLNHYLRAIQCIQ